MKERADLFTDLLDIILCFVYIFPLQLTIIAAGVRGLPQSGSIRSDLIFPF